MQRTFITWNDYIQNFFQPPVYIKQVRADLVNGTFVVLHATENSPDVVGRIIDMQPSHQDGDTPQQATTIIVNVFKELSMFNGQIGVQPIETGASSDVTEIVQVQQAIEYEMGQLYLLEVTFVFSVDNIETGIAANCMGIKNAFVSCFRTHNGVVEPIEFILFPSQQPPPPGVIQRYPSC